MAFPSLSWLRGLALAAAVPLVTLASSFVACSNDNTGTLTVPLEDASQPPIPKLEAGVGCVQNNDCLSGLSCLYPATSCASSAVCAPTPPDPCPNPQPACSCISDPITVCNGYTTAAFDYFGACESGTIIPTDAGQVSEDAGPADASDASDD